MSEIIARIYQQAIFNADKEAATDIIRRSMESGMSAEDIVFYVIIPSMDNMVKIINDKNISVAQQCMASQISAEIVDKLVKEFVKAPDPYGKVVIGTPEGDFHSLGKKIVVCSLRANMLEVHDLGVNISASIFVEEAVRLNARVIAVSTLMSHTASGEHGPRLIRKLLQETGKADSIKIIVGGVPFRDDWELYKEVGADAWAPDASEAARVIRNLMDGITPMLPEQIKYYKNKPVKRKC